MISTFPIQLSLQNLSPLATSTYTSTRVANMSEDEKDTASVLNEAGIKN